MGRTGISKDIVWRKRKNKNIKTEGISKSYLP
jgi:hypothetical protein